MLQKIRDNAHGWWTWVLVPVLIIIFALFGIQNYLGGSFSQNEVAKVNGEPVSIATFSTVYQSLSNAKNPNQNPQMAQALKFEALESLINKLLFAQGLQNLGFQMSDANINQMIYQIPAFQQNGQFSMPLYQAFLQNTGETTQDLKADLKESALIGQFQNGLMLSQFALPNEISTETKYANMLRDIAYVTVPVSLFTPKSTPSEADIQTYYTANQANFMTPLQVKLAYVTISQSQFVQKGTDPNTAQAQFSAALNQIANLAFQNAGSLAPIAQAYHLNIQTTGMLNAAHPTDILANPAVLQAVTSDSVLNQGNNSSVINLSPTQALVLRVVSSVPQQPIPLNQVKAQVIAQMQQQQALNATTNAIHALADAVNQGGNLQALAKGYGLTVSTATAIGPNNKTLSAPILSHIATLGVHQATVIPLSGSSFMVAAVTNAYPAPDAQSHSIAPQAIMGLWTQIEMEEYLASLQNKAKVRINQALFKQS